MAFGEELLHFWKVWRLFDTFQDQKNAACFLSGLKQLLPVIYEISKSCFHNINLYTWNQLFAFHLLNVIGQGELNISLCSLDLKALNSKIFSLCLNMQICVEMYLLFLLYTSLLLYVAEIFACYAILDHFIKKNIHHGNLVEKKKIYIIVLIFFWLWVKPEWHQKFF